jgi:hypothetical protein
MFRGDPVRRTPLPVPDYNIVPFQHYCRDVPDDVTEHGDLKKTDFESPEWPRLHLDRWNALYVIESLFDESWTMLFDQWFDHIRGQDHPHELQWQPPPPEPALGWRGKQPFDELRS